MPFYQKVLETVSIPICCDSYRAVWTAFSTHHSLEAVLREQKKWYFVFSEFIALLLSRCACNLVKGKIQSSLTVLHPLFFTIPSITSLITLFSQIYGVTTDFKKRNIDQHLKSNFAQFNVVSLITLYHSEDLNKNDTHYYIKLYTINIQDGTIIFCIINSDFLAALPKLHLQVHHDNLVFQKISIGDILVVK